MTTSILSRRRFLGLSAASATGILLTPKASLEQTPQQNNRPPALSSDLVKEFVIAGHGNVDRVKELLAQEQGLLNATWDWGGGDFETALGGAGHMGRKDIAEFLINKGCRMDIFVATMLGKLDVVKAMLTAYPELIHSKGPHGLTFLHHARKGGEETAPVLKYLESLGAA
ncbi:MAG: ankyrin repeat domain-containing protein [bacterium]